MAQLMDSSKKVLVPDLRIADGFWTRLKGLLGTKSLPENQGLWIHRCNSIHTFFMNYAIDCVFVDEDLKVLSLKNDVRPGRVVFPIVGAKSVIELKSGKIQQLNLAVGDQLHVGT